MHLGALFGWDSVASEAAPPPPAPSPIDLLAAERAAGRAEGEAAAMVRMRDEQAKVAARHADELAAAGAAAGAAHAELAAVLSESMADLVLAGLRAILTAAPTVPAATVHSLVREALDAAPAEGGGRVCVHTSMLAVVQPLLPDGWRLDADPLLAPGAVRAEVDASVFAAALAQRLERLAPLLTGEI